MKGVSGKIVSPSITMGRVDSLSDYKASDKLIALLSVCHSSLNTFAKQKADLKEQAKIGMLSLVDAEVRITMINEQEFEIKKRAVEAVHITSNGKVRKMTRQPATPSYPKGYYYTKLKGGRIVKAKDMKQLILRLYTIYFESGNYELPTQCLSVRQVFDLALTERQACENLKDSTVIRMTNEFKKYIRTEFADKNIMDVTDLDLKKYSAEMVNGDDVITKKQFLAYKGVLNLIFRYALSHHIITTNPVEAINNKVYLKSCDTSSSTSEEKIFSEDEIALLVAEVKRRMSMSRWSDYYPLGFALIFSSLTGCRIGEICAMKWDDVDYKHMQIHIHAQQIVTHKDNQIIYLYDNHTKNEKGLTQKGRYYPIDNNLDALLTYIKDKQREKGIVSEYIFCLTNGQWINVHGYTKFLRRICKKVGLEVTNNHAFRMSLNSNVMIPKGLSVTERAELLGHSISTNLNNYSFAPKGMMTRARSILNDREPIFLKK